MSIAFLVVSVNKSKLHIFRLSRLEAKDSTAVYTASPQALIITPTRELALKIYNEGRKFAQGSQVKCVVADGGTSKLQQQGCNILVATPDRLLDDVEKGKISFKNLNFLVLDEFDKLVDVMDRECMIEKCLEHKSMPSTKERYSILYHEVKYSSGGKLFLNA